MALSLDNFHQLIESVKGIVSRYKDDAVQSGADFNIFQIIGLTSDEVRVHSAFLATLLDPQGSHRQGDLFLQLFTKQLSQIVHDFDTKSAVVECEKYIGRMTETTGGRIDIHIEDKKGHKIIIENKIYAPDQTNQLIRYHNYAPDAVLLYLTLDGKEPGKDSVGDLIDEEQYYLISYSNEILDWLTECYEAVKRIPTLAEGINHYINLIKIITNQSTNIMMTKEIAEAIASSSSNIQTAIEIQRALQDVKINIQQKFWNKLIERFQSENYKVKTYFYDTEVDDLSEYIRNFVRTNASGNGDIHKNKWYGIEIPVAEIDKYSIQWRIEVDHNIYYGFKIHKDSHLVLSGDKTFDYLRKHLSGDLWQYGETWLAWKYPNDKKYPNDERFNFREFSSSEIFDLADDNLNMIDRIVKESIDYIEDMRDELTRHGYANASNTNL